MITKHLPNQRAKRSSRINVSDLAARAATALRGALAAALIGGVALLNQSFAEQAKPRVELLVMEQIGCAYCEQWRADIGESYDMSSEAQRAPLRYVNINKPIPGDLKVKGTAFTPSFVLTVDGVEVSRMEGYLNESFFWGYLDAMLDKHLGKN